MSPDIRELFDDAADDSGRSRIDAARLVAKGRRKVRIRQYGAVAGVAALVAVAALGVSQWPALSSDGPLPPARTPTLPVPATPVPSTPKVTTATTAPTTTGAEVIRKLSYSEGVRRCRQRMQAEHGQPGTPDPGKPIDVGQGLQYGMYVTDLLRMKLTGGNSAYCSVPGETWPDLDFGGPSNDPREVCGQLTWLNLTSWLVTYQADGQGGFAATLMSPDRKAVLLCDQDGSDVTREKTTAFRDAYVYLVYGPASGQRVGGAPNGVVGSGLDATPIHFLGGEKDGRQFWGGGGIAKAGAVRYALYAGPSKLAEVPVENGLYAMRVWLPAGVTEPTEVRVYDRSGKVIEQYQPF